MTRFVTILSVLALLASVRSARAVDTDFLFEFGSFGGGDGQFNTPTEIAIGPTGDVFVFDAGNGRIQKFSADGVYLGQWSSNRPGYPATNSIAIGAGGLVLLQAAHFVLHYDADGHYLYRRDLTPVSYPCCTHLDTDPSGNLYWSRQVRGDWVSTTKHAPDTTQEITWDFTSELPVGGAAIDAAGTFFVATWEYPTIVPVPRIARRLASGERMSWPGHGRALDVDGLGNLYSANPFDDRVDVWTTDGVPVVSFGNFGSGPGEFNDPWDIEATPSGRIYVVDKENDRIQVFGTAAVPVQASTWGRVKADYR
jgi:tripartite motif-containing protein 71